MFKELNKHLMWQLDRLTSIADEDLSEVIEYESKRADAIIGVSREVIKMAETAIEAHKISLEYNVNPNSILGLGHEKDKSDV